MLRQSKTSYRGDELWSIAAARAFTAKQTNADGVTLRRKRRFTTATKQQQYAEGHDPLATSVYLMLLETISTTYTAHMMRNNQRH